MPDASVAVQIMVVVPSAKTEPEAALYERFSREEPKHPRAVEFERLGEKARRDAAEEQREHRGRSLPFPQCPCFKVSPCALLPR